MGTLAASEYETAERTGLEDKTELCSVEDNGPVIRERKYFLLGNAEEAEPTSPMANNMFVQSDSESDAVAVLSDGHELDAFLGKAFEEKSTWAGLYESIRDLFFPPKLPPLELTSTPIPVPDRMAMKPNPWAYGIAVAFNVSFLCLLLFYVGKKIIEAAKPPVNLTNIELSEFKALPKASIANGGGGGGNQTPDQSKGHLPPKIKDPQSAPAQPLDQPKLPMLAGVNVQPDIKIDDDPKLPNIGIKSGTNVRLGAYGSGNGSGIGSGSGNGIGSGSGGNCCSGLYKVGGAVSPPVALNSVEAEFSDEARRAKYQGVCLISLIVDAQGNPQNPRVIRTLGMGLDEKALEAVRKYKFKPAMNGKTPVPVMITVEVNFRLY